MSGRVATELSCLKPHGESIVCAVFAPGSDVLCTGSHDMMVHLWRVSDGWTCRLRAHTNWVTCLAAQPSGMLLASGSADETLRLWDLTSLLEAPDGIEVTECDCTLKNYGGAIRCCDFSRSGELLCSGSADSTIRVWRMGLRSCDLLMVLRGHKGWVMGCSFSPTDETMLASASSDGSVRLWRVNSGDCLKKMRGQGKRLGKKRKEVLCCKFHPSGDLLCAAGEDKTLRLWRVHDGACVREFEGHKGSVRGCDFQPGGGRLLASCEGNSLFGSDNSLRLWDLAGDTIVAFEPVKGHKRKVNACTFSNDGSLVATVSNDNSVRIWLLRQDLHPPADALGVKGIETAISEYHSRAPSLYNGSDGSTTSSRSNSIVSHRDTDSGAGVFGVDGGSAVSARSTDTHSSHRAGLHASGEATPSARREGGDAGESDGSHQQASASPEAADEGKGDEARVNVGGGEGGPGSAHIPHSFVVRESDQEQLSARSGSSVGSARQWVQLRKPWRVEARLLDMADGKKVVNQSSLVDEGLDAGAQSNPVQTRGEDVGDSGEVMLFELVADFGTMEVASPQQPLSNPLHKMEPRPNGIKMVPVDSTTGQKVKPPSSGKTWGGKLSAAPRPQPSPADE